MPRRVKLTLTWQLGSKENRTYSMLRLHPRLYDVYICHEPSHLSIVNVRSMKW